MSESDTSRTDAAAFSPGTGNQWEEVVDADFARQLERELAASEKRRDELREAIVWALGAGDEFDPRENEQGPYWWRLELWKRAKLVWNGDKFLDFAAMALPAADRGK